jgi:ubiquinone/menaquinone biosynthesis C-methylase UbiE
MNNNFNASKSAFVEVEHLKVQAAYKSAATCYHHTSMGDYQRQSARHLLADLWPPPAPGETVLDVGCGTGIALLVLLQLYPQIGRAVGLDLSPEMLERARQEAAGLAHPVEWYQADAQTLPFEDDTFNLIISHNAFHWFPDRPQALAEMKRVLAPGGRIALLFEGAGARQTSLGIRRSVLQRYGLKPPAGFGTLPDDGEIWNSLAGVEKLVEAAGFSIVDLWGRQSYVYLPVAVFMAQFKSTADYWKSAGLDDSKIAQIFQEIEAELQARATERGVREVLYPVNVIAAKDPA